MDTSNVEVLSVNIVRQEIKPEYRKLLSYAKPGLIDLPLAKERISIEIKGVPTAVANAIRRVMCDEMEGHRLAFRDDTYVIEKTTDPFMINQFVRGQITRIPLRPCIPDGIIKEVRWGLDIKNGTTGVLTVYSGDLRVTHGKLTEHLFNPTFELLVLQPGRSIYLKNIYIVKGRGREDGSFKVASQCTLRHLDIDRLSEKEIGKRGTLDTNPRHIPADWSGYKESSLISNPRHHLIEATIPAVPRNSDLSLSVVINACTNIKARLKFVKSLLEEQNSKRDTVFILKDVSGGSQAELHIRSTRKETHTIGNLLKRSIYELNPEIQFVGYKCNRHENVLKLVVRHNGPTEDISPLILKAIEHTYGVFDTIQRGLRDATNKKHSPPVKN